MRTFCLIILICTAYVCNAQYLNTVYDLDIDKSFIEWKGSYSFNFGNHKGFVKLKSGSITTYNNTIIDGEFVIDMTTIASDPEQDHLSPIKHLKNEDFFYVEKFPVATLKFNEVKYIPEKNIHEIVAALTIRGVTKTQKFYATANGAEKSFVTQLKIDRTRWGIIYNHKLKDDAISDAIEFDVRLFFN
ncbi:YceI family protein [Dokdonia sp. Hel_I_53]|uniref:YceI family protein n=1 Tax=Dokdonia sp. Hel_I_53 TaxID=1566287 RepID=UPI001199FB83|nr:YceI family protein [Dokdonia sp. Hel_I_53]TVZ52470.1 polyisoprenoid-binding protein YceI [Dokdonia sp. Hel_I_53]